MSFVEDHIRSIDGRLEHLVLTRLDDSSPLAPATALDGQHEGDAQANDVALRLRSLCGKLSRSGLRSQAHIRDAIEVCSNLELISTGDSGLNHELGWLVLAKATNLVYGQALEALISQVLPLNANLHYYSEILTSRRYTTLYSIQTSPKRLWHWSLGVYREVESRGISLSNGWRQFYDHVRAIAQRRSLGEVQHRFADSFLLIADEVRRKHALLQRAKRLNAGAVGYLLSNVFDDERMLNERTSYNRPQSHGNASDWKHTVMSSILVIDNVIATVTGLELDQVDLEEALNSKDGEDQLMEHINKSGEQLDTAAIVHASNRLSLILSTRLPDFQGYSASVLTKGAKPSGLTRYWLPAAAFMFSSSLILRVLLKRRAEILQWIRELGSTIVDFWNNWVVVPTRKVIGTIRHDEDSEVSIMSKRSLEGDRESLERMVVDFAMDNPEGPSMTANEVDTIRNEVHEGDLTPVLKAYERELKSPLYGSIRGNLIRTLLIQIQKTKVDVEVAMGGIDNLLKSQELVFGFVGLTPGVLVCFGAFRWLGNLTGTRQQAQRRRKGSFSYHVLRNIDRILTASPQSDAGTLSFEDFGLLVCEAIALRELVRKTFPRHTFRDFEHDFSDLIDNSSGVGRQIRVADRIRWAYARWL